MLPDFLNPLSFLANATIAALHSTKYNITLTTSPLTDFSRHDPSDSTPRTLMLSIFQPTICNHTIQVPYMPDQTVAYQGSLLEDLYQIPPDTSIFSNARLTVCSNKTTPTSIQEDSPILLFSPGYTVPRLHYSLLASEIASEGFTVITIDHPEDANIITYPDGHAVYNNDTSQHPAAWEAHLPARIADVSFIIDQLGNATAMADLLPHHGHRPFPTDRIAMFGHSLGGVTSVIAASQDPRIQGAVNWDGTFVTLPLESGMTQPVLLIGRGGPDDATWPKTWPLFKGMRLWVKISKATHMSFSDVPTLMQSAVEDLKGFEEGLGRIKPEKMMELLVNSTTTWMDDVFGEDATVRGGIGKFGGMSFERWE